MFDLQSERARCTHWKLLCFARCPPVLSSSLDFSLEGGPAVHTEQLCCFLVPQAVLYNNDVGRVRLTHTVPAGFCGGLVADCRMWPDVTSLKLVLFPH